MPRASRALRRDFSLIPASVVNGGAKLVHPGGAKLVHLTLCGTRSEAAWEVPVDPPGQPLHRRLSRYFWGFPPFLALVETIALAVHFQDMDMVGEAVQQSLGQAFIGRPLGVSIHAPTRGATRRWKRSKAAKKFRSTPPREGRQPAGSWLSTTQMVSIHAPTRGATAYAR